MNFLGKVVSIHAANQNSKLKYAVVEVKNKHNLDYRLFIPGDELKLGQMISIELTVIQPQQKKQAVSA